MTVQPAIATNEVGSPQGDDQVAIALRDIDKRFAATHALKTVSLNVVAGEVHAIVGENGAGKSTLVKIVSGVHPAGSYEGDLLIDGVARTFTGVKDAEDAGVFLVPQELNVVPHLSVAENLFLNREHGRLGLIDYKTLWGETARWLKKFRLDIEPTAIMRRLGAGQQEIIKIAHAMSQGVQILILDEPTAALTEAEIELLFARVKELRDEGVTTLYISHRLPEISRVADRVTIMRDGRVVETLNVRDRGTTSRRIVYSMVGRNIDEMYPKSPAPLGDVALGVRNLRVDSLVEGRPPHVDDVSLAVRHGEILGVYGAIGSGISQLVAGIFGVWPGGVAGEILVEGRVANIRSPLAAIGYHIGYVSEDRKRTGLVMPMSVSDNISLVALKRVSRGQLINAKAELAMVQKYVERLRIKMASADRPVAELSGGNQQKVVAAKWLAAGPDIIILEQPTHGIDVGAKVEIYALMNELAHEGRAILFVSSELPEVLAMSDRIHVLYKGRLVGTWDHADATEGDVTHAATGGGADTEDEYPDE
jgi:ABC-type sugar transport system ATPase subunit